jgi:uncharacterized protein YbjT (DUF2867 family)
MGADSGAKVELLRLHGETDNLLRNSGVPSTILQPNSFHQNILSSADTIRTQRAFYWPLKNAAQSTVDIRDINAVAARVFTSPGHEGKAYVITGPEALTFQQAAEKLSAVLGREIQYVDVPLSAAADGMLKSGMPEWNVRGGERIARLFCQRRGSDCHRYRSPFAWTPGDFLRTVCSGPSRGVSTLEKEQSRAPSLQVSISS